MNDYITIKRESIKDEWLWNYLNEIGVKSAYDLQGIAERVCPFFNISVEELQSSSRKDNLIQARTVFCFIAYRVVRCANFSMIGEFLNRDHSTTIHSLKRFVEMYIVYKSFSDKLYKIIRTRFPSFYDEFALSLKRMNLKPIQDGTR